jgi:hypothetical protein
MAFPRTARPLLPAIVLALVAPAQAEPPTPAHPAVPAQRPATSGTGASRDPRAAPERIEVGSPLVDGTRLQPYTNQWSMKVWTKDGRSNPNAGVWKDRLEAVRYAGRECWKRTQEATFRKKDGSLAAVHTTVNIVDRRTLEPLFREFRAQRENAQAETTRIRFERGALRIETTSEGKTEARIAQSAPAFDYDGGLYAVLIAGLPLRPGFSASFPSYSERERPEDVSWHLIQVTGSETIQAGALGTVDALVVSAESETGPLSYWLITRPPYVLRMDYTQPNGTRWILEVP